MKSLAIKITAFKVQIREVVHRSEFRPILYVSSQSAYEKCFTQNINWVSFLKSLMNLDLGMRHRHRTSLLRLYVDLQLKELVALILEMNSNLAPIVVLRSLNGPWSEYANAFVSSLDPFVPSPELFSKQ